ncbi:OLC1v1000475C1 [Oldenlandia corymbosa var. corymbosa]|uniref:OLC1v1000475C1 n=1 Tax=Oldenlandia corymbosa var. corymbosa TaxID=529605 RepID=A0AAV1D2U5_OLDCO|nr:OLC1v1000475C1 [Oldenlandia corymbosa var. corymbosa]
MGAQALNRRSPDQKSGKVIGGLEDYDNGETPRVLALLASMLEKSILKNEKLLKGSNKKEVVTVFHGSRVPALSIRQYIERIFKYANCSPSCFVVAYIYLDRFLQQTKSCLTSLNVHRLLITSFVLAAKYVEDECYNNAYYAKVGGITTSEMNKLEMKLLVNLEFRLHVDVQTFDDFCFLMEEASVKSENQSEKPFRFCGLRKGFTGKDGSSFSPTIQGYSCRAI